MDNFRLLLTSLSLFILLSLCNSRYCSLALVNIADACPLPIYRFLPQCYLEETKAEWECLVLPRFLPLEIHCAQQHRSLSRKAFLDNSFEYWSPRFPREAPTLQ